MELKNLTYTELSTTQKEIELIIAKKVQNYILAINKNNASFIKDFIDWGIPIDNEEYSQMWNNLSFNYKTKLETFIALDKLKYNYKNQHDLYLKKIESYLINLFNDKNILINTKDDRYTCIIQWIVESYPKILKDKILANELNNCWGFFQFSPERHQILENFLQSAEIKSQKVFLRIMNNGNKETVEYFFNKYSIINSEKSYLINCLDKAINCGNKDAIEILLKNGVRSENKNPFQNYLMSYTKREEYFDTIDLMIEHYGNATFNDQILLKTALAKFNITLIKYLLENHYKTQEDLSYLEKIKESNFNQVPEINNFFCSYKNYLFLDLNLNSEKPIFKKVKV